MEKPPENRKKGLRVSLSARFLLLVLPVMFLVSLVFLGVLAKKELQYSERLNRQVADAAAQRLAVMLATPVWNFDFPLTETLLKTALQANTVRCARLRFSNDAAPPIQAGQCEQAEDLETFAVPVAYSLKGDVFTLAQLQVFAPVKPGWSSIAETVQNLSFLAIMLFLALILAASLAFRLTILRPLRRVSDSLRQYQKTGVRHAVDWRSRDELGLLIGQYNESLERQTQTEQHLETQLKFEKTLKDTLPIPIAVVALDQRLHDLNPAFYRQLQLQPDQGEFADVAQCLPGLHWAALLSTPLNEVARVEQTFAGGILSGQSWIIHVSPFTDNLGFRQGVVIALLNITERIAAEQQAHQAATDAERALQALKQAQQSLVQSEKMASLGSLVAGIAHEINTPVGNSLTVATTLNDRSQAFRAELASGALRKSSLAAWMDTVDEAVRILISSLHAAAEQISNFKQVAVDQTSSQRRAFDLAEVVHEVIFTLRPRIKHTGHRVEVEIPRGIQMDSYPGPLGQVITNLFNNALIHAFEGRDNGVLSLVADVTDERHLLLKVSDNGKGIPEENQQRIFDPFFTTRMGQGGSGLGLNLVYSLITGVLGGYISVTSTLGEGTCFEILLPLAAPVKTTRPASDAVQL